ncbi:hypothetical protein [Alkaliphilus serpentinus]|uniref:Uncharacterized protein n=1 Tax=Alkaliphilus serpentinus TaxID=1482731 RepID=A0A833HN63_9FIRM|nr:hypothetical protein [Alkaliphilus serpentinus]KAB3529165.1 hypothetical protein F8153_10025 [Alkaliphilus serpentinus]
MKSPFNKLVKPTYVGTVAVLTIILALILLIPDSRLFISLAGTDNAYLEGTPEGKEKTPINQKEVVDNEGVRGIAKEKPQESSTPEEDSKAGVEEKNESDQSTEADHNEETHRLQDKVVIEAPNVPPTIEPIVEEVKEDPVPKEDVIIVEPDEEPAIEEPPSQNRGEILNSYVLSAINNYKSGSYPYLLNTDYQNYNGVTESLYFQEKLLLKGHPSGNKASHCSGITFEVFYKAMVERNKKLGLSADDFNGMTYDELYDFLLTWYVASSNKKTHNLTVALEKYGLGVRINNFEDARPGDFIDISRENHTGHTAVFLDWIRDEGKIVGFKYWSSQESTGGISYNEEYFNIEKPNGEKYGNVIIDMVFIGRGSAVKDYK